MRKFGIEIELNSFDKRDFKKNPLGKNELPEGITTISNLIKSVGFESIVSDWGYCHNNKFWVCKPDSSCGIEVCSPVLDDFSEVKKVVEILSKNNKIQADHRCSLHVHLEVLEKDISSVLGWWVKCEHLFFDSVPDTRKLNKYCQCIGLIDLSENLSSNDLIYFLGSNKYYSANCFHFLRKNRLSIEFRLAGNDACLDIFYIINWIKLLQHFVEKSIKINFPDNLFWINLIDFFDVFDFSKDTKYWFINKILYNIRGSNNYWNISNRKFIINEIEKTMQLDKYL